MLGVGLTKLQYVFPMLIFAILKIMWWRWHGKRRDARCRFDIVTSGSNPMLIIACFGLLCPRRGDWRC
jgi:hypothetical protein